MLNYVMINLIVRFNTWIKMMYLDKELRGLMLETTISPDY